MLKEYRLDIDILKGISIIAVILYHIGILPYGYLGVDTFLVINGFLIIPTLISKIEGGNFSFFKWLLGRVFRFYPLLIIAFIVCLVFGYFYMLPDDFENLCQSVVASSFFSNNILSAITTKNYWDTANEFKPLMHLWYLGVLIHFYIVFPLIVMLAKIIKSKFFREKKEYYEELVLSIGVISFVLYLLPNIPQSDKFYYVQYRLWEFCIGGFIAMKFRDINMYISNFKSYIFLILLILIFSLYPKTLEGIDNVTIIGQDNIVVNQISKEVLMILIVSITSVLLIKKDMSNILLTKNGSLISYIGRMSLSLFIWHQIFLAFLRYSFIEKFSVVTLLGYLALTFVISFVSYKYIEKIKVKTNISYMLNFALICIIVVLSFIIYRNAGVVRDVPELNITKENPFVSRNTEYTDRIYQLDKDFSVDKRIKVLVVGNSFARDFAAVLLEWDEEHILDISYKYSFDEYDKRYAQCDYLFCFGPKEKVPAFVWNNIKNGCDVYGIGTKSYGKSLGMIFAKRNTPDYYLASIPIHPKLKDINDNWKKQWGDNYIDFVEKSLDEKGNIRPFTDDKKIISFDCRHLTEFGAKFYAQRFCLDSIFKIDKK